MRTVTISYNPRTAALWHWELKVAENITREMALLEQRINQGQETLPIEFKVFVYADGELLGVVTPSDVEEYAYEAVMDTSETEAGLNDGR